MGGATRSHSAGTSEIARESGGDSMPVDGASALETTLTRLRQRYALNFYLPAGARPRDQRHIDVQLSSAALRRYPDAEVRFRRTYLVPDGVPVTGPAAATAVADGSGADPVVVRASSNQSPRSDPAPAPRRRRAVNEDGSSTSPPVPPGEAAEPSVLRPDPASQPAPRGWRRVDGSSGSTAGPIQRDTAGDSKDSQSDPGWRRAKPDEP